MIKCFSWLYLLTIKLNTILFDIFLERTIGFIRYKDDIAIQHDFAISNQLLLVLKFRREFALLYNMELKEW